MGDPPFDVQRRSPTILRRSRAIPRLHRCGPAGTGPAHRSDGGLGRRPAAPAGTAGDRAAGRRSRPDRGRARPGQDPSRSALAQALDLPFRRIQFTPDLLPADLTGTQIYRPATGTFDVRPGPIVTSVLLADEINRAPAKVQSALLEAMQEGQITVGDETIVLPETFWVLATQNPIEHEGTYPLPEAQLDRFLMKLVVGYPDRGAELTMLELPSVSDATRPDSDTTDQRAAAALRSRRTCSSSARWPPRSGSRRRSRNTSSTWCGRPATPPRIGLPLAPLLELGASPRATIALVRAARGHALLAGRDFVTPHDVKSLARDIMRHRILVSFEADAEGLSPDDILQRILDHIPVP